jgi:hypothetical protein
MLPFFVQKPIGFLSGGPTYDSSTQAGSRARKLQCVNLLTASLTFDAEHDVVEMSCPTCGSPPVVLETLGSLENLRVFCPPDDSPQQGLEAFNSFPTVGLLRGLPNPWPESSRPDRSTHCTAGIPSPLVVLPGATSKTFFARSR